VVAEKLFVVMMFVHWAGFYADLVKCQGCSKAGCHPDRSNGEDKA